ncbi:MAG: DUF4344 domain-containing metallopeptidase [Pseudomonadota bacterium]
MPAPMTASKLLTRLSVALLCLGIAVLPARAGERTGEALGVVRAIFYHELGHGMIDAVRLPVVGPEEAVVDEFSTYVLILTGQNSTRQIEALRTIGSFWYLLAAQGQNAPAWGEHSPSDRRAYAVFCLLYGSNPAAFADLVITYGVPPRRAAQCEREYREKEATWIGLLQPHLRGAEGAGTAGFEVRYEAPSDETRAVERLWQQSRFLESLANEAGALFGLPRPMPVIGRSCGFANAYWDGTAITLCYELTAWIESVLASEETGDGGATSTPGAPGAAAGGMQNLNAILGSE